MNQEQIKPDKELLNPFVQFHKWLIEGKLSLTHVQIALRASIRDRKDIPDEIKDLLAGKGDSHGGLIYKFFKLMNETMGNIELAFRRGKDK